MTLAPHIAPPTWPEVAPGRFASTFELGDPTGCRVALVGLPDDLGVRLNGGRPGAAEGPAAFRAALARFGGAYDARKGRDLGEIRVFDVGDVEPIVGDGAEAMRETHGRVTEALSAIHRAGMLPICIGGGHDLTYASVRALAAQEPAPLAGINFDAHLDVREEEGSGMPFRRLIDEGCLDPARFVEFGAGRFSCEPAHTRYLRERGAHVVLADRVLMEEASLDDAIHLSLGAHGGDAAFVSIDLDAIDASQAPGVSAANPVGLPAFLAAELAYKVGMHRKVKHFDIMELNPRFDADGRTARVAAHLFMEFVAGVAERGA